LPPPTPSNRPSLADEGRRGWIRHSRTEQNDRRLVSGSALRLVRERGKDTEHHVALGNIRGRGPPRWPRKWSYGRLDFPMDRTSPSTRRWVRDKPDPAKIILQGSVSTSVGALERVFQHVDPTRETRCSDYEPICGSSSRRDPDSSQKSKCLQAEMILSGTIELEQGVPPDYCAVAKVG
jgi:hypothetical protein